jgi:hypothetical protein
MHANHEEVARTDSRRLTLAAGAMESAKLANQIIVANLEVARFTSKLHILRFPANHGVLKNAISRANSRKSLDDRIGSNLAIRADFYVIFNDGSGVNRHFSTGLQDFQDNPVLWIVQILFMMLGCSGPLEYIGDESFV